LSSNFSFKASTFAKPQVSCKIMSALPLGYMWMHGRIHAGCGRMLSATETRILLQSWHVDNPNHLRRGSVGVKKTKRWWAVSAWGASGSSAPGTPPAEKAKLCSADSCAGGGAGRGALLVQHSLAICLGRRVEQWRMGQCPQHLV
jgi:hypothetical protein